MILSLEKIPHYWCEGIWRIEDAIKWTLKLSQRVQSAPTRQARLHSPSMAKNGSKAVLSAIPQKVITNQALPPKKLMPTGAEPRKAVQTVIPASEGVARKKVIPSNPVLPETTSVIPQPTGAKKSARKSPTPVRFPASLTAFFPEAIKISGAKSLNEFVIRAVEKLIGEVLGSQP